MERATGKKGVMKRMNEQEKKEITEMTEADLGVVVVWWRSGRTKCSAYWGI